MKNAWCRSMGFFSSIALVRHCRLFLAWALFIGTGAAEMAVGQSIDRAAVVNEAAANEMGSSEVVRTASASGFDLAKVTPFLEETQTAHAMSQPSVFAVAGKGNLGFEGDGTLATRAALWFAAGVATDQEGHVFVADSFNNRVRYVDAKTGVITTIAGTGAQGFSGDGGPAAQASLNSPSGLAVDAKGNVLIADTFNNRIRMIDRRTGIIHTIAGAGTSGFSGDQGPAVQASLSEPAGVAVSPAGDILIADTANHRIRVVEAGTGIIRTLAGTGMPGFSGDGGSGFKAQLNNPAAVAVDLHGHVLIADTFNNRIRRLDMKTKALSTIAGNGVEGSEGDGSVATAAELTEPAGVAVDAEGNVFIADTCNNRIRRIESRTGIISTMVGTGERGLSENGAVAALAQLNNPVGLTRDPLGHLVVADAGNHRILRVLP